MKRFIITFLCLSILILPSCVYHNLEDLYPVDNQDSITCDTSVVTYNVQIKPILDSRCISCHYAGHTYPTLDNFSDAKAYAVMPGNLLNEYVTSNHENSNLDACEQAQIKKWIETGAN